MHCSTSGLPFFQNRYATRLLPMHLFCPNRTRRRGRHIVRGDFFAKSHLSLILPLILSKPNPLRWVRGWVGRGSESLRLECRAEAVNKRKKVLDLTSVLSPVPFFVRQKLAYGTLSRSPAGLGSSPTSIFAGLRPGKSFECGYTRIACPNVRPHKFLPLSKVSYENPL